jgi:lipase chaperone LimK
MRTASSSPASDGWGRALLAGALLAGLAGGAVRLLAGAPRPVVTETAARVTPPPRPALPPPARATRREALVEAPPALPASLSGTDEDGALRVDAEGDLILGPEVRRLFDYYLAATGEESGIAIRARLAAAIQRRHLGPRGEAQAMELLDTYLGYREATRRLRVQGDDPDARLEALRELRRRAFGADVAEKLFGEEERVVSLSLERRRVLADTSLPDADRAARLSKLEKDLPPDVQRARAEATRPLRERADEDAMRASGAGDDDIRAVRVASYGEDGADRLAALDLQRAAWRARLGAFRDARAEILASEPDPGRQRAAVQQILDASFTPLEQIRVEASGALRDP